MQFNLCKNIAINIDIYPIMYFRTDITSESERVSIMLKDRDFVIVNVDPRDMYRYKLKKTSILPLISLLLNCTSIGHHLMKSLPIKILEFPLIPIWVKSIYDAVEEVNKYILFL